MNFTTSKSRIQMFSNSVRFLSRFRKLGFKVQETWKLRVERKNTAVLVWLVSFIARKQDKSGCARWKCRATNPESQLALSQPPETETEK